MCPESVSTSFSSKNKLNTRLRCDYRFFACLASPNLLSWILKLRWGPRVLSRTLVKGGESDESHPPWRCSTSSDNCVVFPLLLLHPAIHQPAARFPSNPVQVPSCLSVKLSLGIFTTVVGSVSSLSNVQKEKTWKCWTIVSLSEASPLARLIARCSPPFPSNHPLLCASLCYTEVLIFPELPLCRCNLRHKSLYRNLELHLNHCLFVPGFNPFNEYT